MCKSRALHTEKKCKKTLYCNLKCNQAHLSEERETGEKERQTGGEEKIETETKKKD